MQGGPVTGKRQTSEGYAALDIHLRRYWTMWAILLETLFR